MPRVLISLFLLLLLQAASAQMPVLRWAKAFQAHNTNNSDVYNNGRAVGVDPQGNVYSVGLFSQTIDMDPGTGVSDMTGGSPSQYGIYISKLDANGNFVWAKQIPTIVEFAQIELKVDKDGNVYVASLFSTPADMDPGPGVLMMKPTGFEDAFVIKLNTNGDLLWVKQFGGPGDTGAQSTILEIDKDNNVIVCGLFNNTIDFDPGPGTFNITSTAHMQSFIVKLNSNGDLIWAKQFGNSPVVYSGSNIIDVRCDAQGNIFTVGYFVGSCDFDPGPATYIMSANTMQNGFISKLTPNGDLVWAKQLAASSPVDPYSMMTSRGIEIDSKGNIVTAGWFNGTFDFDPGPGLKAVTSAGHDDCYILKLTGNGDLIWVETIGGDSYDEGDDLALDGDDNIYFSGTFGPTVDYDPGPGDHTVSVPGYGPGAIVKLNSDGSFVYAAILDNIFCRRLVVDDAMNIYTTGSIPGLADFDPGPGVFTIAPTQEAPFVLKLGKCANPTSSTLDITDCNYYSLNNKTFDRSGTYTQVIPNKEGCDSVITLHLTLTKKFTDQTKIICEGDPFVAGGGKQNKSGTYLDTLQTTQGCDSIVTTYLTVNPRPSPDLGPDKYLCSNSQLQVSPGSFSTYSWQDLSAGSNYTITATGTYWVEVSNEFGCTASDTLTVPTIEPVPSDFLKATDSICIDDGAEVSAMRPYDSYKWSTGATGRKLKVQQPGVYWLAVTDEKGCQGTDSITIYEKPCVKDIYVPSGFTPNGDGRNDIFKPMVFRKPTQYRFAVYNRWGTEVFQTADPRQGWDGRIGGNAQADGVFIWTCYYQFAGSEPKLERGTVVLIR